METLISSAGVLVSSLLGYGLYKKSYQHSVSVLNGKNLLMSIVPTKSIFLILQIKLLTKT